MSEMALLRIGIAVAISLLFAAIIFFSRSEKSGQGKRRSTHHDRERFDHIANDTEHTEAAHSNDAEQAQHELPLPAEPQKMQVGMRPNDQFDRIVSLYVAAKAGSRLHGPDIVVAAEKAGLTLGYMDIFHRLVDGRPEAGPIFSVANIIKPGSFDLANIADVETPAIAFFLTLPAPVSALEAWETMEPAAQRMADLLDGIVLDEERNALGRQRIQHVREELRTYDRQHAAPALTKTTRW
jgi:cell division protein ZipA